MKGKSFKMLSGGENGERATRAAGVQARPHCPSSITSSPSGQPSAVGAPVGVGTASLGAAVTGPHPHTAACRTRGVGMASGHDSVLLHLSIF